MQDVWQSGEAGARFGEVMRRALSGDPQIVRDPDGAEVVVMARRSDRQHGPTLKDFLLAGGPCSEDDDLLEQAIAENRRQGLGILGRLPVETL